jgi:hypothetical protein
MENRRAKRLDGVCNGIARSDAFVKTLPRYVRDESNLFTYLQRIGVYFVAM